MRQQFDVQMQDLKKKIIAMSRMVNRAVLQSMQSLKERDLDLAESIIANDGRINDAEREIEQICTLMVATQQPIATDLRKIVASYKIIASLERMGDHAVDIAKVSLRIGAVPLVKNLEELQKMTDLVSEMINIAIEAFTKEDIELARSLGEVDHQVDRYYKKAFNDLNDIMVKNPIGASQSVYLLLVARYLERIGDYCTNLGEEVIYTELGIREYLNV